MTYDGRAIANSILDLTSKDGLRLTNMQLQKILYFCHAHHLVELNTGLVTGPFQAWEHGPVLNYVYDEFKHFKSSEITARAYSLDKSTGQRRVAIAELADSSFAVLQNCVAFYSRFSGFELRQMSHVPGGPWDLIWNANRKVIPGMKIPDETIRQHHSTKRHLPEPWLN